LSRPYLAALALIPLLAGAAPAAPDVPALRQLAVDLEARLEAGRGPVYQRLLESGQGAFVNGPHQSARIILVDPRGLPRYYVTDNVDAAATVSTNRVHPGGGAGFSLTGSGMPLGRLAIWDGGAVRTSHDELTGRATQMDGAGSYSSHATHVSGTMIAGGADPDALGMSYEGELGCYDWNQDTSEMATAAANGLLISNHSYGYVTGWRYDSGDGEWYWYGDLDVSTDEDYGFGFYDDSAAEWDQIAHDAPDYLIVCSAGNDRNDAGPGPGQGHWHWDGGWVWATDTHDPDGAPLGYDSVAWLKNAKNVLAVGAIEDIPLGYTDPGDVVMSEFSGWGPTDDGRIKPDLVANGVGLYSSTAGSNSSYSTYSGTSMASPNASGSVNLVAEHWMATHGATPARAATIKAILFQTTDEAGAAPGPDYEHGWGLLNTESAVELVQADADAAPDSMHVIEAEIFQNTQETWYFLAGADEDVKITINWTDPAGTPVSAQLDPTDPMLVNDLDLRIDAHPFPTLLPAEPWVLDPADPAAAATRGDNFRDNTEQVVTGVQQGETYDVIVTHKGTLQGGSQTFSIASSVALSSVPPPSTAAPGLAGSALASVEIRPNPFRAGTSISFSLAAPAHVSVEIFDVNGRRVRTLAEGPLEAGNHRHDWNARDGSGRPVAAGVYFSRIVVDGRALSEKIVRLD
jgi:hypothetical protein